MNTQAQDLFTRALELPEAKRDAFLAEACGEDAELRLEVQQLLADAERADSYFGDLADAATIAADGSGQTSGKKASPPTGAPPSLPTAAPPAAESITEKEGDEIGPYKLRQPLGEGGFGTVWMAEQSEPISRMVALKVIKAGMDTRQVLARFEAERQALAMMDHPHIAKVLDAGATPTGRPWFAMELVKGIPITDYCDEAGLGTKERLALFGDVCAAINHAHQKGIIHRDIKPSNVMVTLHGDKAVVKVIDFGIAKATQGKLTDQTLFTKFEQMIGTPVYMSPEQASLSGLDIDTRSDIYALGILLYELLVGKPPFDSKSLVSAGYEEMRRIIREVEPPKPSSHLGTVQGEERTLLAKTHKIEEARLNRLVEPDLDWIVMKAIDKDRARRYETANAFAADIVRFLTDEPVTATPPSAGYQFRKFARRNKGALRVAAAIAAVLVAATVVSTWQAVRATRAENLAAEETERTKAALGDAKATSQFLTDMFASAQPGERKGGREVKVADVLDRAVEKLKANRDIPPARRATLQATLGKTYYALGLYPKAIPLQEEVLALYRKVSGPEYPGTLGAMHILAVSYSRAGRLNEALAMFEEGLPLRRKVNGPEHPDTLSAMAGLANSYSDAGRLNEALTLREEVLELRRKVSGPEHPDTLTAMHNLALSYGNAGRLDEALAMQEEVLALRRKLLGPEHPDTLTAVSNLALSYYHVGRRDESLKLREEMLALSRKVSGPEHPDTLGAMHNLALSYSDAGRLNEALAMFEEGLPLRRKVNGPEHPDTLSAMAGLANSYSDAGRLNEALAMREEVLELRRKVSGPEHPDTLTAMRALVESYHAAGRRDEALKLQEEVLALSRKVSGPEHPDTLTAMHNLALSYGNAGRLDEALTLREEVLELRRKVSGPEHPDTLAAMHNLAASYSDAGRLNEALAMREEVLELRRKVSGPEHPDTLAAMHNLAASYSDAGRLNEALAMFEEGLPLRRKVNGPEHPDTLSAMAGLANSYSDAGRLNEALTLREEVLELRRKVSGPEHPDTLTAMHNLALSYGNAGRLDEALAMQEEVLALRRKLLGTEHPGTLSAMAGLANSYSDAGRLNEALTLREEVLELRRKVSGPEHPDTLTAMHNLAISYGNAGRLDEALAMQEEVLALRRKLLGPEHPGTLSAMTTLAISYSAAGREDEALAMREELLALSRKVNGPEHPDTLRIMSQLSTMRETRPEIVPNPLGFSLGDLAARDEAGRTTLLGEPDLEFSGGGQDDETGVRYDKERSYTVKDCTLDLLILGGVTKQVNLTTGFDNQLKGIAAVRAFLGDTVKMGDPETSEETTFHRVQFGEGGEGRVYVEFDEDGVTDTFKLVMPEAGAEPGKQKDASKSK